MVYFNFSFQYTSALLAALTAVQIQESLSPDLKPLLHALFAAKKNPAQIALFFDVHNDIHLCRALAKPFTEASYDVACSIAKRYFASTLIIFLHDSSNEMIYL